MGNFRPTKNNIENLALAQRLVANGLRPSTAADLLRLTHSAAKALWSAHYDSSSPRGSRPSADTLNWYLRSSKRAVSASLLGAVLNRAIHVRAEANLGRIESFCDAWEYYRDFIADCGLEVININRAWNLLEILESGRLEMLVCPACGAQYLDFPVCDRFNLNRSSCLLCARLGKAPAPTRAAPPDSTMKSAKASQESTSRAL
jgi:hypothetical protein